MEAKEISKHRKSMMSLIWIFIWVFYYLIMGSVFIFLTIGSVSSILLLNEMYPELAAKTVLKMFSIFTLMGKALWLVLLVIYFCIIVYLCFFLAEVIKNLSDQRNEKIKKERNKFMNELVKKIKKDNKRR